MNNTDKETKILKSRRNREEIKRLIRNPLALSDRFGVKDDENFCYRVVLANSKNSATNIERFKIMGYEMCDTAESTGQKRSGDPSRMGSSTLTQNAKSEEFVIMRIPRDLYEENQQLKREVFASQLEVDGNNQKQKVTHGKKDIKIDGGVLEMNTPLHSSE